MGVNVRVGRGVRVGVAVQSGQGVGVDVGSRVGAGVEVNVGVQPKQGGAGVAVLTTIDPVELLGASSTNTIGLPPMAQPKRGSSHLAAGKVSLY